MKPTQLDEGNQEIDLILNAIRTLNQASSKVQIGLLYLIMWANWFHILLNLVWLSVHLLAAKHVLIQKLIKVFINMNS